MAVAHLSIHGSSKNYGQQRALHDVDLTAYSGEVLAVLGKNGAGKTSLINSALGMHSYQADQLELFGHPITAENIKLPASAQASLNQSFVNTHFPAHFYDNFLLTTDRLYEARIPILAGSASKSLYAAASRTNYRRNES